MLKQNVLMMMMQMIQSADTAAVTGVDQFSIEIIKYVERPMASLMDLSFQKKKNLLTSFDLNR